MVSGVGIAMAVISTAATVKASKDRKKAAKKAHKKQEKASALESKSAEISNARDRRQAVARRRMKLAEMLQGASDTGVAGGTSLAGASGSLSSNVGSALGFQNTRAASAFGAGALRQGAQADLLKGEQSAGQSELVGSLAASGFKHRDQINAFGKKFGSTGGSGGGTSMSSVQASRF